MGYYINPPNSTKEAWLAVNGTPISADDAKQFKSEGSEFRVVCLVNNGDFTAAGIAYDDR